MSKHSSNLEVDTTSRTRASATRRPPPTHPVPDQIADMNLNDLLRAGFQADLNLCNISSQANSDSLIDRDPTLRQGQGDLRSLRSTIEQAIAVSDAVSSSERDSAPLADQLTLLRPSDGEISYPDSADDDDDADHEEENADVQRRSGQNGDAAPSSQ